MNEVKRARRVSLAERKRANRRKAKIFLTSVALAGILAAGSTVAWLADETTGVTNTFATSEVATAIDEKRSGETKSEVKVKNTGDIDAYIRAAVVVTWQDASGNVYGKAPVEGADYSITWSTDESDGEEGRWLEDGGFYYWSNPVAPGEFTGELIDVCSYSANAPEGYFLNVEIIGSGIQADGTASSGEVGAVGKAPVEIAWGVTLDPETKTISKS